MLNRYDFTIKQSVAKSKQEITDATNSDFNEQDVLVSTKSVLAIMVSVEF